MNRKLIFIISILISVLLLSACGQLDAFPTIVNLEDSIKEIISSKGENYDFLNDELYLEKMNELVNKFVDEDIIEIDDFLIANLDNDNIPEVIVFRERDINDPQDTGYLEVYSFNGEKYALLDRVSMNYDNDNYNLKAGKISEDQNGILLSNSVGKGFGVNYGFILEDKKLKSILDDKKLNLISIDTVNKIKDIDEDGILNFSIYTVDPECDEENVSDKDKLLLWYKWDGANSGELVDMERIEVNNKESLKSNKDVLKTAKSLIGENADSFIKYVEENLESISKKDMTHILKEYMANLDYDNTILNSKLNGLYNKYKIPLDKINDKEYISSEDTISIDEEIKKDIQRKLNSGYKIELFEKEYRYTIDYKKFIEKFKNHISNEYRDYLRIQNLLNKKEFNLEKSMEKISIMEKFILTYPYSKYLDEIKYNLQEDMAILLDYIEENPLEEESLKFIENNYSHTWIYENIFLSKLNK